MVFISKFLHCSKFAGNQKQKGLGIGDCEVKCFGIFVLFAVEKRRMGLLRQFSFWEKKLNGLGIVYIMMKGGRSLANSYNCNSPADYETLSLPITTFFSRVSDEYLVKYVWKDYDKSWMNSKVGYYQNK